jgi:integrase
MNTRRRGRGVGSIVQRADGRWMGRVDLGWREGKRRTKAVYGRTRRAVTDRMAAIVRAAQEGILVEDERQSTGQFMARWLTDVARSRVRPLTYRSYENAVSRYIVPHLGHRRLAQLTPEHVQAFLSTLERAGASAARRAYVRVVLRNALNTALRWRLVVRNAAMLVDPPRIVAHEIQPLNPEQAQQLLKAAQGDPLDGLVTVALSCGLRRGEMLGLQWSDVDLDGGMLHVRRALQRFGGDGATRRPLLAAQRRLRQALQGEDVSDEQRHALRRELAPITEKLRGIKTSLQLVELKSARSRRSIALPAVAATALRAHRVRQLEARLAAGARWQERGFVFTSGIGTPIEPRRITREFRALLERADLPTIRLHDLRHSCATLLLAQGVSPRVVMETLGHSQVSLTLNTYSHVLPALQRDAATKMDAILGR